MKQLLMQDPDGHDALARTMESVWPSPFRPDSLSVEAEGGVIYVSFAMDSVDRFANSIFPSEARTLLHGWGVIFNQYVNYTLLPSMQIG